MCFERIIVVDKVMTSNYSSSRIVFIQVLRVFNCISFMQHLFVYVNLVACCVFTGGSCVEADSNDITECPRDYKPSTGMFGISGPIFSAFMYCVMPFQNRSHKMQVLPLSNQDRF